MPPTWPEWMPHIYFTTVPCTQTAIIMIHLKNNSKLPVPYTLSPAMLILMHRWQFDRSFILTDNLWSPVASFSHHPRKILSLVGRKYLCSTLYWLPHTAHAYKWIYYVSKLDTDCTLYSLSPEIEYMVNFLSHIYYAPKLNTGWILSYLCIMPRS